MADILIGKDQARPDFSPNAPYGNSTHATLNMQTNASGIIIGGNKATAAAAADVVILGRLFKGTEIGIGCKLIVSDAFTAATTIAVGFRYIDGVDVAAVPEDADYFLTATATSATGITEGDNPVAPVRIPKDVYVIGTIAGATHAAAGRMDMIIDMELKGAAS